MYIYVYPVFMGLENTYNEDHHAFDVLFGSDSREGQRWVSIIPILKGSNIFKTLKRIKQQPETYWLTLVNIGIG